MKWFDKIGEVFATMLVGAAIGIVGILYYILTNSACFGPHKRACVFIYDAGKFFTLF